MRLSIMQPYLFPYIGYYQLIHSVDKIVMYDDVNFIKQGWINRNRILLNGKDFLFTVPIKDISSNKPINETLIDAAKYTIWANKFLMTLQQNYKKAPFFELGYNLVESVLKKEYKNISDLAVESITVTKSYIGLKTQLVQSSSIYNNHHLKSKVRVIDICKKENASKYNNPSGGQELYTKDFFSHFGIELNFIEPKIIRYKQYENNFVPWLSIIDVIMFNSVEQIMSFVKNYNLI